MPWTDQLPSGYRGTIGGTIDFDELADLMARTDIAISGSSTMTRDSVATWLGQPEFDSDEHLLTVRSPEGVLVAVALFELHDPFVRSFTNAWVSPDQVGQGIGGAIISWATETAHECIGLAPPDTRVTMSVGANDRNERAQRLFAARGFAVGRYFLEMEISLDDPVTVAPVPHGITLRTIDVDEPLDALAQAVTDSFMDHFGYTESPPEVRLARWNQWRTSEVWDDSLVWIAEGDGRIAGVNVCLRENGAKVDQGYVATLGVLPEWRGRGLAKHLLTASFAEYQSRGKTSVALHVDADSITGATRLYRGVGMHEVQTEVDFERELRSGRDIVVR